MRRRYDLGLIGGALLKISDAFQLEGASMKELIVGAAKLGAVPGTLLGGAAMTTYGRTTAIAAAAVPFTLGPLIMAAAWAPG